MAERAVYRFVRFLLLSSLICIFPMGVGNVHEGEAKDLESPVAQLLFGGVQITKNSIAHSTGLLPVIYYALTEPNGEDIYPLGEGAYALYGLYDTGSSKVRISTAISIAGKSDVEHLKLSNMARVNVRLNGLNTASPEGNIPIGQNAAQIEVKDIVVKIDSPPISLIGTSVANKIVAYIDYTRIVTDSAGVQGPYMDFFWPGEAGIPVPNLTLQLEQFGGSSTDAAEAGKLYWLRNVTFVNGGSQASDQQGTLKFFYDTGTTLTLVNDRTANALNLSSKVASGRCYENKGNLYVIASVFMDGSGGRFQVDNPAICWPDKAYSAELIMFGSDAVIGSNLFDQVGIVLDGPAGSLGILSKDQGVISQPGSGGIANVCQGIPSRFAVGMRGRARRNPTRLRSDAFQSNPIIRELAPGTEFVVIGGPKCGSESPWWQVRLNDGTVGWIEEGWPEPGYVDYYIEPVVASAACAGKEVSGFCWYFGADSEACTAVCAAHGGYNDATRTYAGSEGSAANCRMVLEALAVPVSQFFETTQGGLGCFAIQNTSGAYFGYWDKQPTRASATYGVAGRRRCCACQH